MPRYHPKSKLLPLHLLHNLHGFQACCKVLQYIALLMCGLKLCFNAADDTLTKKCIHNMGKGLWTSHSKTLEIIMELPFLPHYTPPPSGKDFKVFVVLKERNHLPIGIPIYSNSKILRGIHICLPFNFNKAFLVSYHNNTVGKD